MQFAKQNRTCDLNPLKNADNKEIFDAYKYIKNKDFNKIPSISYQNKTHVNFEEKCDAFIHAYYSNQILNMNGPFFDTRKSSPLEKISRNWIENDHKFL